MDEYLNFYKNLFENNVFESLSGKLAKVEFGERRDFLTLLDRMRAGESVYPRSDIMIFRGEGGGYEGTTSREMDYFLRIATHIYIENANFLGDDYLTLAKLVGEVENLVFSGNEGLNSIPGFKWISPFCDFDINTEMYADIGSCIQVFSLTLSRSV